MENKLQKRIDSNPIFEEGYKQNYYLFFGPRYKQDRDLAKYSSFIGFESQENLTSFCQTFRNEKELLDWYYDAKCRYIYDLLVDKIEKNLKITAFNSQTREVLKISYSKKVKKNPKKVNDYFAKSTTRRQPTSDWGTGARSRK